MDSHASVWPLEGKGYVATRGFPFASFSSSHPCFERHTCKTGRHTTVVGCEVKILHSELFPGSSAVLVLSGVNTGGYTVLSFFPFFFFTPPHSHALAWPLELGIRTPTFWCGHAKVWEFVSPTQGAMPKRGRPKCGSPYPQLKGPRQSVGVHIPSSRGHTEVWESASPTQGALKLGI